MLNELSDHPKVPVESLRRGLVLLELLCEHGTLSLAELSSMVGLKRTTVHNLLKTLVLCGYVSSLGDGRYLSGSKLRLLSSSSLLHRVAHGHVPEVLDILRTLSAQLGEALVLTGLLNGRRAVLVRTRPQQAVQVSVSFLEKPSLSLWDNVTGIVLAANVAEDYHPELLRLHGIPASPWLPLSSAVDLAPTLRRIKKQGYLAQMAREVYAVAVPILDDEGNLLAALGLHMPAFRHQPETDQQLLNAMQTAARQVADVMQQAATMTPANLEKTPANDPLLLHINN